MALIPIDTDIRFGQEDYPGRLIKRNFELLLEIPFKFLLFPMMIMAVPLFIPVFILLPTNPHLLEIIMPYYLPILYLAALSIFRNYHIRSFYDNQTHTINEELYIYRKLFRQNSWSLSDFTGISYGTQGASGSGYYLSIRLHGHHLGQMLLSFLSARSREEMIRIAHRLSEITGLPLLPEMTTGPQHRLDDMRNKSRWSYLSRIKKERS